MTAYFISGLGADERLFENIRLPHSIIVKHIHWIEPLANESLADYCKRLSGQIDTSNDFVLIGVSFGGIVAIELNKFLHPRYTIIISTVTTHKEFPLQFYLAKWLKLYQLFPASFLKTPNFITDWFFSAETKEEKELLKYFLKIVSPNYLRWAMNVVLHWKNEFKPPNLLHIHGERDRIFPSAKTHPDIIIKNAGHFMVYDHAEEISEIIARTIEKLE